MEISREVIKAAADRNMIVYDQYLTERVVSARIINLLKQVAKENCAFDVVQVFVPADRPRIRNAWECLGFHIQFIEDRRLDADGEFTLYFLNELKGMLPPGSDALIVATDGDNQALLGSV